MEKTEVVIIGSGLSGLSCAAHLAKAGVKFVLLERGEELGGRSRTEVVEGFRLNVGFQPLFSSSDLSGVVEKTALDLRPFSKEIWIHHNERFIKVSKPWAGSLFGVGASFGELSTFADRRKLARLVREARDLEIVQLSSILETSTFYALHQYGFSTPMVENVWKPYFGTLFLDTSLETSSRLFWNYCRLLTQGDLCLPGGGTGTIAALLASKIPPDAIRLKASIKAVEGKRVTLDKGAKIEASLGVVIATGYGEALKLLEETPPTQVHNGYCLYYSLPDTEYSEPVMILDGEGTGLVSSIMFPSALSPDYAPEGKTLCAIIVPVSPGFSERGLEAGVKGLLIRWFGPEVRAWTHLRTYPLEHAIPEHGSFRRGSQDHFHSLAGIYMCGSHFGDPSVEGAISSGKNVAEAISGS